MKKGDVIVISLVMILSIVSIAFISLTKSSLDTKIISIKIDGEIVKKVKANKETTGIYDFSFKDNVGKIQIMDGKVRMLRMEKDICPQQICSDTGWIQYKHEVIVCLPNKIVVSIQDTREKDNEIDEISF